MNTRLFNEQLAVIASKCDDMHLCYETARTSGRTYRNVLRTLLMASSKPNQNVLYATYTHDHVVRAFRLACDMTSGMDGRRARGPERQLELPNGSVISFRSSRDTGYEVTKKFTQLVRDSE